MEFIIMSSRMCAGEPVIATVGRYPSFEEAAKDLKAMADSAMATDTEIRDNAKTVLAWDASMAEWPEERPIGEATALSFFRAVDSINRPEYELMLWILRPYPADKARKRADRAVEAAKRCLINAIRGLLRSVGDPICFARAAYVRLDKYDMTIDETMPAWFRLVMVTAQLDADGIPSVIYSDTEQGNQYGVEYNDYLTDLSLSDIQGILYAVEKICGTDE